MKTIKKGIYLVVDPAMDSKLLLEKLGIALREPISAIQLWDNFDTLTEPVELLEQLIALAKEADVPIFINNRWEYLLYLDFDGIHFDEAPVNLKEITNKVGRPFLKGITCGNNLKKIDWAIHNQFDYLSFCSIFPSSIANSCELVNLETIAKARALTSMPIFLAGGIKPENLHELQDVAYDGIAVVSGVMRSDDPAEAIKSYQQQINLKHEL